MLYFGVKAPALQHFIKRAYLDMCRTLRGLGKLDDDVLNKKIYDAADQLIRKRFDSLRKMTAEIEAFDLWHYQTCIALRDHFNTKIAAHSPVRMTYGQAQKWINMTIKYSWFFGAEALQWIGPWLPFAHVAVDEVILNAAVEEGAVAQRPCTKWSTWANKNGEYQAFQSILRTVATQQNKWPLELEAAWWEKHRPALTLGREED